ncbi:unnamed protein product [[Actinomadura] parvosata subsp. kistnae]|nr:unnamed protein product [Actinomadura parvosata subsp. kistnae]
MTPAGPADVRGRPEGFAGEVFTSSARREQRSGGGPSLRSSRSDMADSDLAGMHFNATGGRA